MATIYQAANSHRGPGSFALAHTLQAERFVPDSHRQAVQLEWTGAPCRSVLIKGVTQQGSIAVASYASHLRAAAAREEPRRTQFSGAGSKDAVPRVSEDTTNQRLQHTMNRDYDSLDQGQGPGLVSRFWILGY
jgi:hypothetical protein